MSKLLQRSLPALAVLAAGVTAAYGQALPTSQPKLLTIYRERIKVGHAAAHVKTESGWPAAYAKANSPDYYLAMASISGPSEVWFIAPWDSYTAWGKAMTRDEANAELTAELDRLSMADAEHVEDLRVIEALARPDLSHGGFPDLNKTRFWEITIFRTRPGHSDQFASAAKAYKAVASRALPKAAWRVYQVSAGLPGPVFLVFSSVNTFGELDAMMANDEAAMKAMTPEEQAALQKFSAEGLLSVETNRYRLDPSMSYVPAETKAADPAFWSKK